MPPLAQTQNLLREIERSSGRTLNYRDETGLFIEAALRNGLMPAFNEAIFLAKFVTKSAAVMKRIGADGEGYAVLAAEFQAGVEKASLLLKRIAETLTEEERRDISRCFFSLTPEGLEHLIVLLSDFTVIKNWMLDGHTFPEELKK
jgi:hypothetical protein